MIILIYEHITGGGLAGSELPESWAVEGSAMRRALATDFGALPDLHVRMTLDSRLPDEPGPWEVVRVGSGSRFEFVADLALRADYTLLIAPETAGVLGDLTRIIDDRGGRTLGSTPKAIELTTNKYRLGEHWIRNDLPTPPVRRVRPRGGLPIDASYPAVLKPVDGAGAVETFLIRSPTDPTRLEFSEDLGLLQPWIDGEARSATFLIDDRGTPRLVGIGRQEIACINNRFAYLGGTILNEPLPLDHPTRRAVTRISGLRGLIGVDYLHDPETGCATLMEINPRPTTSVVGLVAALGPGRLAGVWLGAMDHTDDRDPFPLAQPDTPLGFRADGTILPCSTPLQRA